jgi:diguanylate cyclase
LGVDLDTQRADGEATPTQAADRLVAQTQMHVEGFADMMAALQNDTRDFGRDLVASVNAINESRAQVGQPGIFLDDVARITATMIGRVHEAEQRLEKATHETSELRKKLEEARGDALRDPLTGLPNRRALEEAYATAMREGRPVCVAVCDVDHFKSVNDRFGHAVGDRVLRAIAQALSQACEGHFVARYGGEEFAILLHAHAAEAVATVEVARQMVAEKRYRLRETDSPLGAITFSAGVTCAISEEPLGTAFHRADSLLYTAKAEGRNRILFDGKLHH